MVPRYLKGLKKDIENLEVQENGTRRGCAGTTNHRVTCKPGHPLKETRNSFP